MRGPASCVWCGGAIEVTGTRGPIPRYCTPMHRQRAYEARIFARTLVGIHEIAQRLGVSRQRAFQLADKPHFPKPVVELAQGRIWRASDVDAWAKARGRQVAA